MSEDKDKVLIDAIAQDVSTFFLDENAEYNLETLPRIIALHVNPALATVRREGAQEARDRIISALRDLKENFIPVNQALEIVVERAATTEGGHDGKQ